MRITRDERWSLIAALAPTVGRRAVMGSFARELTDEERAELERLRAQKGARWCALVRGLAR